MDRLALEALQAEEERLQKSIEETQRHNEEERIRFMTSSTNDCSCRSFGHQDLKLLAIRACLMQNTFKLQSHNLNDITDGNPHDTHGTTCHAPAATAVIQPSFATQESSSIE
ncbi:uncharacterized protein LOC124197485 [Daphnia pulex]|uniref:uncharacterized protein LOC124197485 n=1 Tax=Daphnia pulex TaxID=6669 RepID=UPI001EDE2C91|nr:uncharacterized protein LOC124197485 [Daphnia pulex]XP_046448943.1 uncharacterized protein LOC124197485 [Daphnia pulex]XP_046448944.1 uncharacterized protein LOC124197485 [Daphnia pulex]